MQYSYDSSNRLTQVIDANGDIWKYGYDSNNNMTTITNPRQITYLTNKYDSNGRVYQQIHGDGGVYQFNYITDPLSNVTETDMTDPRGNVRKVTFNQPPIYYDGYSTGGTSATDTYAAGTSIAETTTYQYDPGTYLLTGSTDALGRATSYAYDLAGNLTNVTRLAGTPNQVTTNYTYQVDFSKDFSTGGNYQTLTRLSSVTDPLSHTTQYTYDLYGNRLSVMDPAGNVTQFSNDAEGRIVSIVDAMGETAQLAYDGPDLYQVTDPLGRTTTISFGLIGGLGGRLVSVSDPVAHTTQYQYSPLDQLTAVVDPFANKTSYGYDGAGDLINVTDSNNHSTQYGYDNMDRLQSRQDPLGSIESYQYDVKGNLTQVTDRRGKVTTYSYDSLNRLTFAGYGTQPGPSYESTVNYTYDTADRIQSAADSLSGTITRGYDGLDRITSETTPQGSISYVYDAVGRRQTMTVVGQPSVNYTFDVADNLTQITQGALMVQFSYDAASRRTALTLPSGVITAYGYDNGSQVSGMTYSLGFTLLGNLTYGYNLSGKRTSVSGSFARTGIPMPVSSATYNLNNQLVGWGGTSLSYDLNGNLASDGAHTYTWDARSQLKQVDGGATASFTYDPFGRRVSKSVLGAGTSFLYDGKNPVQELSGATVTANLLATTLDEYLARTDASGTRYFLRDAAGSTAALADPSGTIQTSYTYDPFGGTSVSGSPTTNAFAYAGGELDATGLYFYRTRYYDQVRNRFPSEDPFRFKDGTNSYIFAANDPVTATTLALQQQDEGWFWNTLNRLANWLLNPPPPKPGSKQPNPVNICEKGDDAIFWETGPNPYRQGNKGEHDWVEFTRTFVHKCEDAKKPGKITYAECTSGANFGGVFAYCMCCESCEKKK